jgi:hypothetical protein
MSPIDSSKPTKRNRTNPPTLSQIREVLRKDFQAWNSEITENGHAWSPLCEHTEKTPCAARLRRKGVTLCKPCQIGSVRDEDRLSAYLGSASMMKRRKFQ